MNIINFSNFHGRIYRKQQRNIRKLYTSSPNINFFWFNMSIHQSSISQQITSATPSATWFLSLPRLKPFQTLLPMSGGLCEGACCPRLLTCAGRAFWQWCYAPEWKSQCTGWHRSIGCYQACTSTSRYLKNHPIRLIEEVLLHRWKWTTILKKLNKIIGISYHIISTGFLPGFLNHQQ